MIGKEEIILGSGDLFFMEYTEGGAIPADAEIEAPANMAGNIKGGASLEYKPETYDVENDYAEKLKSFVTKEDVTFKSGVLTWGVEFLRKLIPGGEFTKDPIGGSAILKIGGRARGGIAKQLLRFRHEIETGRYLRVTLVGSAASGFTLTFDPAKETVIDAEFKAMSHDDDGTLVILSQDLAAAPAEG